MGDLISLLKGHVDTFIKHDSQGFLGILCLIQQYMHEQLLCMNRLSYTAIERTVQSENCTKQWLDGKNCHRSCKNSPVSTFPLDFAKITESNWSTHLQEKPVIFTFGRAAQSSATQVQISCKNYSFLTVSNQFLFEPLARIGNGTVQFAQFASVHVTSKDMWIHNIALHTGSTHPHGCSL